MVNQKNFTERLRDARSILDFAEDSYQSVLRICDIVQSNEEFFNASPGADKLELAVLKLKTLVAQWNHERTKEV